MAAGRNEIPEDLMIEILQRLPVKSILRFRCVCKSWSSLLKSPSFMNNHLNMMRNSNSNNTAGTLLVSHYNKSVGKRMFSFLSAETLLDPSNGKHIQFPTEYEWFINPDIIVIGSCNGIYCLKVCNKGENTLLWNPATREVKVVQYSDVPKPRDCWIRSTHYGFGFDPKTNDYKVVRLRTVHLIDDNDPYNCFAGEKIKQIELYSLRIDSWRQLHDVGDIIFPRDDKFRSNSSLNVYMNGRYHWWVDKTETDSILSFDMGDEEFRTMPLPDLFNEYDMNDPEYDYRGNVAVLNESTMTSIVFPYEPSRKCYDIWVMHEYGVKESWTKEYVIGPTYLVERPLAFWKNNGGLFFNDISGQLILYNSTDQEAKHVQITGADGCFSKKHLHVLHYVESLVSLKGRPELEEHIVQVGDMA